MKRTARNKMRRLTSKQFALALRKGQGRALLHANQYGIDDVKDVVLNACLHNQVYDPQCEGGRESWIFRMFKDTSHYGTFRESLLNAIIQPNESDALDQICGLMKEMAAQGDPIAKKALWRVVKKQVQKESPEQIGIEEWIELEGAQGLIDLARLFGRRLQKYPESWPYDYYFSKNQADQDLKKDLFNAARQEPAVKLYWNYLRKRGVFKPPLTKTQKKEMQKKRRWLVRRDYPIANIIRNARNGVGDYPGHYTLFARYATAKELLKIYALLMGESDEAICMRLLWVFRNAAMPRLDKKILLWANGSREGLRAAAIGALSQLSDRRIHKLAQAKAASGEILGADNEALDLFLNNYHRGDGALISHAVHSVKASTEEMHCLGYSIVNLAKRHKDAGLEEALRWTYENTPCMNCRYDAIVQLDRIGRLDAAIINECLYDASEEIRTFATEKSK
ncbi:MAG TPA: hypothetical protein PKB02_14250 [Anaerohalosphaeraceae bacterium]|nr:hypothetical protein [Anaerohalosphaeraceae bacterium]